MRAHLAAVVSALISFVSATHVAGGQSAALERGARIRVQQAAGRRTTTLVGDLVSASPESLVYRDENSLAITAIRRDSIVSVERSVVDGNHRVDGALLGLLGGVVVGGTAGYGFARARCGAYMSECLPGAGFVIGAGAGGFLGLIVGAIIGSGIDGERWEPVDLPRRIGLSPRVEWRSLPRVSMRLYY